MKGLIIFNRITLTINITLLVTITLIGLVFQIITGCVQIIILTYLLQKWKCINKSIKIKIKIYLILLSIYILIAIPTYNMINEDIFPSLIISMIIPMILASYFTFIIETTKLKK